MILFALQSKMEALEKPCFVPNMLEKDTGYLELV